MCYVSVSVNQTVKIFHVLALCWWVYPHVCVHVCVFESLTSIMCVCEFCECLG